MRFKFLAPLFVSLLCWSNSSAQELEPLADSLMSEHVGGGVLIIHNGETVLKKAYGQADLERQVESIVSSNYRLASITKQFIAFAILMLKEDGKLNLNDKLPKYFPGYPSYGAEITVEDLLQHLSGIPDYARLTPDSTSLQLTDLNALQLLLDNPEADNERRVTYEYSNSGYVLLGLIIEQASGRTLQDFLFTEIFKPLNMLNSLMYTRGLGDISDRAFGHTLQDSAWVQNDQSLYSALRGDGGIYSSLDDLEKWIDALDQMKILSSDSYEKMYTPPSDVTSIYGLGWRVDQHNGRLRYRHSGSTRGFRNNMIRFPESNTAVIILSNDSLSVAGKAEMLLDALFKN